MRRSLALFLVTLALLAGWSSGREGALRAQTTTQPYRTAGDRPIDIQHIRLDLRIDLPRKTVDARATLRVRTLRSLRSIPLDAVEFEVKAVTVRREEKEAAARFGHDGRK